MEQISALFCCKIGFIDNAIDHISTLPLYAGIAVAIAGVALTFFLGAHFIFAIGSTLLGIACVIGLYHARKSKLLTALQEKIDSLELVKNKLEKTNKDLETSVSTFSQENDKLETNVKKIETENEKLQTNNSSLKTHVKNMETENVKLQMHISTLTTVVENTKKTLQKFEKEQQRLETAGTTLDAGTQKLMNSAKVALTGIQEQVEVSKKISEKICEHLDHELAKSVHTLNENLQVVINKNLDPFLETVLNKSKELGATDAELQQKLQQLTKANAQLEELTTQLNELQVKLRETETRIAQETQKLSNVVTKVDNAADRFTHQESSPKSSTATNLTHNIQILSSTSSPITT